jgi:hypothetical protein
VKQQFSNSDDPFLKILLKNYSGEEQMLWMYSLERNVKCDGFGKEQK